jgi:hypothetical protein
MDGAVTIIIDNEDWLRYRTWDLYRGHILITTVDNLLWALRVQNAPLNNQIKTLQHFMTLPAWQAAPEDLVTDVASFLLNDAITMQSRRAMFYSDDEPRDDAGRWTSSGGEWTSGGGAVVLPEGMSPIAPTPSADLAKMKDADGNPSPELYAHMADVEARQKTGMDAGLDTVSLNSVPGDYGHFTAAREEQQQKLVDSFVNAPGVEKGHDLLVMAGGPGSGKTTFLNTNAEKLGIDQKSYVDANTDNTKAAMQMAGMIPDYSGLGLTKEEIGTLVQDEATTITGMIVAQSAAQGKNIAIDLTMKSQTQFDKYMNAVNKMSDDPYHVTMILTDATTKESIKNATGRYQRGGRFVPLGIIEDLKENDEGKTPSRVTFDNNADKVDRAILVSNDRTIVSDTKPNAPVTTTAGMLARMHSNDLRDPDGGFTLDPVTGESPPGTGDHVGESGNFGPYAVAVGDPHSSGAISATPDQFKPGADGFTPMAHQIMDFMDANAEKLKEPGMYLGGWHAVDENDNDLHVAYLDVTQVIPVGDGALESAKALGAERDQIAITDLGNFSSVNTGGTGVKKDE